MQFESKYDVNDKVYVLDNHKIVEAFVSKVEVFHEEKDEEYYVWYFLRGKTSNGERILNDNSSNLSKWYENLVFASVDELLEYYRGTLEIED